MFVIIAAVGKKNELGNANKLIWHIKADMKHFRKTTMGKKVLMGRKTFESLPNLLPGRKIYVATKNENISGDNVEAVKDLDAFIARYQYSDEEICICGGAEIYNKFLPYANRMLITEIFDTAKEADTYFPDVDYKDWDIELKTFGYYKKKGKAKPLYWQILEFTRS